MEISSDQALEALDEAAQAQRRRGVGLAGSVVIARAQGAQRVPGTAARRHPLLLTGVWLRRS
jgi:hypothetical protein